MSDYPEVWDDSVSHAVNCAFRFHGMNECTCPKQYYCEDCDAQHEDEDCPRTVLDDIVDALE